MDQTEKEQLITRICSGCINIDGYVYKYPSNKLKYQAELVYQESLSAYSKSIDAFSNDDAIELLIKQGKWTDILARELAKDIPDVLEQLKIQIFQAYKSNKRSLPDLKDKIRRVKERLLQVISIKRTFDEYTTEWQAERDKTLYLLKECTKPRCYPEQLLSKFYDSQISDEKFRELARSSEWAVKWLCFKKGMRVFSKNLTQEQELLVKWSSLYENILEQQDSPDDEIFEDDDALDGWMIWKKKENQRARGLDEVENRIKDKNASEVYLPVNRASPVFEVTEEYIEESKKIAMLNSPEAERMKRQKLERVAQEGIVKEFEVIDGRLHAAFPEDQLKLTLARNNSAHNQRIK